MVYNIFKLSNFLNIILFIFNFKVGIFSSKTAVYFKPGPPAYDGNTDSSMTHACELILT